MFLLKNIGLQSFFFLLSWYYFDSGTYFDFYRKLVSLFPATGFFFLFNLKIQMCLELFITAHTLAVSLAGLHF